MPNTTSGTNVFEKTFYIDEIIEESYNRIGQFDMSGYNLKTARRSLNILFSEWGNRGLHYWEVANILEMSYRNSSNVDAPLEKISRSQYQALSNKTSTGQPSQYYVQRLIDRIIIRLYLTPGSTENGNVINFWYEQRIQDSGAYTNATNVPYRFVPCMCAGLAYYLSLKYAPEKTQNLKLLYEDELSRALEEDGSSTSTYISPKTYYPTT
jgi:hypothetical protein